MGGPDMAPHAERRAHAATGRYDALRFCLSIRGGSLRATGPGVEVAGTKDSQPQGAQSPMRLSQPRARCVEGPCPQVAQVRAIERRRSTALNTLLTRRTTTTTLQ